MHTIACLLSFLVFLHFVCHIIKWNIFMVSLETSSKLQFIYLTGYWVSPLWYLISITDNEFIISLQNVYPFGIIISVDGNISKKIIWAKILKPSVIFLFCSCHSWNSIGSSVEYIKNLFSILPRDSSCDTTLVQADNKEYWWGLLICLPTNIYLIPQYFKILNIQYLS